MKKNLVLILILPFILSCFTEKAEIVVVDFDSPSPDTALISFHQDEAIHVAIATLSSPRQSFGYYNELMEYISSQVKIPIHYIQKESYSEVNKLLEQGAVDFAFLSSGAYVEAKASDYVDLLVAPFQDGKPFYRSYLITNKENTYKTILDLEGKQFAYSDPLSFSGYYYPKLRVWESGKDPNDFFSKPVFSYGHDLSIQMVNRNIVEAASVNSQVFKFIEKFQPEKLKNVRILEKSDMFGIDPIVCPKKLDKNRFRLYQNIFLNVHKDENGKKILDQLDIDKYEIVEDDLYQGIRKIKKIVSDENL